MTLLTFTPQGAFDLKGQLPPVPENVRLVKGAVRRRLECCAVRYVGLCNVLEADQAKRC